MHRAQHIGLVGQVGAKTGRQPARRRLVPKRLRVAHVVAAATEPQHNALGLDAGFLWMRSFLV